MKTAPPESRTRMWICLVGLISFLAGLYALRIGAIAPANPALFAMASLAVPIVLLDLLVVRVWRRASSGLTWAEGQRFVWPRVGIKLAGLTLTLGALSFVYWAFAEYERSLYEPFFEIVERYGPTALVFIVVGVAVTDRQMVAPEDGLYAAGLVALGRWRSADRKALGEHARAWIIKGFFFPLMFVYLGTEMDMVTTAPLDESSTFLEWYEVLWSLAFAVDVVFSATGYAMSSRLLDTHVESSEPTVSGWFVALVCYEPFWGTIYDRYLRYDSNVGWGDWLESYPAVRVAWGVWILFLVAVYAWASVAFGLRFSNLTRRGILTNGPYRYTKHPAYVAKNLAWWFVSIPFAVEGTWDERVRLCLLMAGVNLIYFLRAKTEERHLSCDPVYVEYAKWIDAHGIFRSLKWPNRSETAKSARPPSADAAQKLP